MTDDAFLGRVLDQALARIAAGEAPDVDALAAERPDLREQVAAAIREAQTVATCRGARAPDVAGYELLDELGRGGMGVVWRARHVRLGRIVALKLLPPGAIRSPRARARFLREVDALARMHHPNVVTVHDVVADGESCAYAMEWIEGCSLADELRRHDAPAGNGAPPANATARLLEIGRQVARALGAVHRAGFLHRDVKPSNILLRRDGTPVLADFGLALDEEASGQTRQTMTGQFLGTAQYAAPEQLRGDRSLVDARADVYALGVTLWECVAGRTPFHGRSSADLLRAIESGDAPPLRRLAPSVPADLATVIAKAMEPDPSRRYATADELADELERIQRFEPVRARPAGIARKSALFARRHRRELVAGGIVLALAGVAGGVLGQQLLHSLGSPARAREHVRRARIELLDASARVQLWTLTTTGAGGERASIAPAQAQVALREYAAALVEAPADAELRVEHDVFALGESLIRAPDGAAAAKAPLLERLRAPCPTTCEWVDRWRSDPRRASLGGDVVEGASALDRRSLGLLALFLGRTDVTLTAWERLDLAEPPDPVVQALLGQLLLAREEASLAYPRLLAAARTWPEAGMLAVDVADAGIRCGDLAAASRWLARARSSPRRALFRIELRVHADLAAAGGRTREAQALYAWMERNAIATPQSRRGHASLWEERGDRLKAASVLAPLAAESPPDRARLRSLLERWFEEAGSSERGEVWNAAIGPAGDVDSQDVAGVWLVFALVQAADPESATVASTDRSPSRRKASFDDFVASLEIIQMNRSLPLPARRLLASLRFVAPSPVWNQVARGANRACSRWRMLTASMALSSSLASGQVPDLLWAAAGENASDQSGFRVRSFIDTDGDGVVEILETDLTFGGSNGRVRVLSGADGHVVSALDAEDAGDLFGHAVDVLGDIDGDGIADLLVGAPSAGPGATAGAGRAYAYSGSSSAPVHTLFGEATGDSFGNVVSGVGDVDADGRADFAICALLHAAPGQFQRGRVYVYSGDDGAILHTLDGEADGDHFGNSIAGPFDLDQDGHADFVIASCFHDGPLGSDQGRIYLYSGATGAMLAAIDGESLGDTFGFGLDGADVDGDGLDDVIAGAFSRSGPAGAAAGAAYAFAASDRALLHRWDGEAPGDLFGAQLAGIGDLDHDGHDEVAISAMTHDIRARSNAGRVYVYSGRTFLLMDRRDGERTDDLFGVSLDGADDLNGDGARDWLAGALSYDGATGKDHGKVYVFAETDLRLSVAPQLAAAGQTVTIATSGGDPAAIYALAITESGGVPLWITLEIALLDGNGARSLQGVVPPGFSGLIMTLQSFALDAGGSLTDSGPRVLELQ